MKFRQLESVKLVAKEAPAELLHRAASFTIISEAVFHTFTRVWMLVVVAGIIFLVVEVVAICKEKGTQDDNNGGAF